MVTFNVLKWLCSLTPNHPLIIVWYRGKDLRISDHEPLNYATEYGHPIPVFVVDPYFFSSRASRRYPHRMQYLLESLTSLQQNLRHLGSELICIKGKSHEVIPALAKEYGAHKVVAQRWSEPIGSTRDRLVQEHLQVPLTLFEGETLHPPGTLRTGNGGIYSVFTPFKRTLLRESSIAQPLPAPSRLPPIPSAIVSTGVPLPSLEDFGLIRNANLLPAGEKAARARLSTFVTGHGEKYIDGRNTLGEHTTSRLSTDLKFGTLSPRTVWHSAQNGLKRSPEALETFCSQLIWRDFAYSSLADRPTLLEQPFRPTWNEFPWIDNEEHWKAWCSGHTGYPIVDAAARQLLETGFVHNRARMVAASFLTKHLLCDYKRGEAHYLRWLTDGDWALNNLGWQWSAGCGCDAQPYFRVFNPMSQGKKFDQDGAYVRRFVPELAKLPTRYIHEPWSAPTAILTTADVRIGESYPAPIVDHKTARQRFLDTAKRFLKP